MLAELEHSGHALSTNHRLFDLGRSRICRQASHSCAPSTSYKAVLISDAVTDIGVILVQLQDEGVDTGITVVRGIKATGTFGVA